MPKKSAFIAMGIIALLIAGMVWWGIRDGQMRSAATSDDSSLNAMIIYYYGEECPHCKRVQEFLEANHIADKVSYTKKEVWHDTKNNAELTRRAQSVCGLGPKQIGVPFVIADEKCFSGETEVMDLFKQKAGL